MHNICSSHFLRISPAKRPVISGFQAPIHSEQLSTLPHGFSIPHTSSIHMRVFSSTIGKPTSQGMKPVERGNRGGGIRTHGSAQLVHSRPRTCAPCSISIQRVHRNPWLYDTSAGSAVNFAVWKRLLVRDYNGSDGSLITVRLVLLVSHNSYAIIPTELLICDEAQGRPVSSLVGNASYVFSFIGERGPRYVRYSYLGSCHYSHRTLVTRLACLACWRRIDSYPHRCGDHCSAVQPLRGKASSSSLMHSHVGPPRQG